MDRVQSVVDFSGRYRPVLIMLLVAAVFSCMHPRFLTGANFLNILKQNSHYGILAAGVCFAILLGGIDISIGSVLAFSGAVAALIVSSGGSVVLAVVAAILIGAAAGLANGVFIARFKLQPMIVSLATMSIFRGATLVLTDGKSFPLGKLPGSDMFKAIGQGSVGFLPVPVLILIVVYAAMFYILNMTAFGRHVYAIGGNEEAARLSGINVEITKIIAHMMSGLMAGVAGVMVTARVASATPTAGNGYEMDAIAAAVIGGISLRGGEGQVLFAIVGAVIIGMLNNILNLMNVSSYYQTIIKGVVILIAVLLDAKSKDR
ncbi:MAG: ribose ABC transporter permease [Clostridia bacterium]|nr:ribose ABC transporter permease [Clostridia bacterium]